MKRRMKQLLTLFLCVAMAATPADMDIYAMEEDAKVIAESQNSEMNTSSVEVDRKLSANTEEYTLDVKSGEDITSKLTTALKSYKNIVIPKGEYTCGRIRLSNLSGVEIVATDAVITAAGDEPLLATTTDSKTTGVAVKGGEWRGSEKAPVIQLYGESTDITFESMVICNSGVAGVRIANADTVKLNKVTVKNNDGYGINIDTAKNVTVSNSKVTKNGDTGIRIVKSESVTVKKTTVSENGKYGINCENSTAKFTSVTSKKNYWTGLSVSGTKTKITVNQGEYTENGTRPDKFEGDDSTCAGIGVYDGATLTATEVKCTSNHGCGIAATGTKKKICTVYVNGCTLDKNNDHGIGARPYAVINIAQSKNKVKTSTSNNKNHGVMLHTNCSSKTISDLVSKGNGKAGMSIAVGSKASSIKNSTFASNKEDGIHLSDESQATLTNCKVYKNKQAGIGVYSSSKAALKKNNKVYENKTYGLVVEKATISEITSCSFTKNGSIGIAARSKATIKKIKQTTVSENTTHGIYVSGGSSATIESCTVESNKKDGIRATDSKTKVSINKCTVNKNKQNGVIITSKAKMSKLTNSTIKKNSKHGLVIQDKATTGTYKNNKISGNKKYQVYVSNSNTSIKKKK